MLSDYWASLAVFFEARFAQYAATPHGLSAALLVSVDARACEFLFRVLEAVQAVGSGTPFNGSHQLPDGFRSRVLMLPLAGRATSTSDENGALEECAMTFHESSMAHTVRLSQRVAAALNQIPPSTLSANARTASAVDEVFRQDVVSSMLDAIIVLVGDGLEECSGRVLPQSALRGLRAGESLVVVSGTGSEDATRNVLSCLMGVNLPLCDCRSTPWSMDTGSVLLVALVCTLHTPGSAPFDGAVRNTSATAEMEVNSTMPRPRHVGEPGPVNIVMKKPLTDVVRALRRACNRCAMCAGDPLLLAGTWNA